jgi:hypothetical protein
VRTGRRASGRRLVGLDVLCGDGARRFLPFPACDVMEKHLAVDSALVFLERDVDFYRVGVVGNLDLRSAV